MERIVVVGGATTSYALGSKVLELCMGLEISAKTVSVVTAQIGCELAEQRDAQAVAYQARSLTAPTRRALPPIALACVEVDGGRMQTRTPGQGVGVHDPHWRENKNAGFFRMTGERFERDPCAHLPACFTSRNRLKPFLTGLDAASDEATTERTKPDLSRRPQSQFRTCLASLSKSDRFGELMAAEAPTRVGFTPRIVALS